MTKEQVMTTALDMFSQYGIKSVSMDDIARNTGISKRTIYEFFEDKETLLQEAIKYHNNTMRKILSELEKGPFTALDVFVLFYEEFMKHPRWYIKRYYDDLKRYPKAVEQAEKDKADFTTRCIKLLNRGGKEGVFQKDLNIEILALLANDPTVKSVCKPFGDRSIPDGTVYFSPGYLHRERYGDFRALRLETFVRYVVKKGIIQNYIQIKSI